jgi:hypothetical protein
MPVYLRIERLVSFLLLLSLISAGCQPTDPLQAETESPRQRPMAANPPLTPTPVATTKTRYNPTVLSKKDSIEELKQDWTTWVRQHPYSNRSAAFIENLKNIPKTDRPDLAMEQEFLKTVDPVLKRVPENDSK